MGKMRTLLEFLILIVSYCFYFELFSKHIGGTRAISMLRASESREK